MLIACTALSGQVSALVLSIKHGFLGVLSDVKNGFCPKRSCSIDGIEKKNILQKEENPFFRSRDKPRSNDQQREHQNVTTSQNRRLELSRDLPESGFLQLQEDVCLEGPRLMQILIRFDEVRLSVLN